MSKERLYIFDTTLRDGAQTQGVHFSIDEKTKIAHALDNLGVDYIEGGWPGANPSDTEFFQKNINFKNSKFTAFGMTKKTGRSAEASGRRHAKTIYMGLPPLLRNLRV